MQGDELACAYHGWRYGADGACTRIPQLADPTRVPARARVPAYRAAERYGLVWVALDEPRVAPPRVPELEDPGWRTVRTGPFAWGCDASRQVENFTDFGHFAFVHPGLLGDPRQAGRGGPRGGDRRPRPPLRLRAAATSPTPRSCRCSPPSRGRTPTRRTRYALHLPYTIVEHIGWGRADGLVYFFASQPVAPDRCIGYCLVARNYNLDQPDAVMQEFERIIFGQDQRVVESQRPEQVPFDLAAELHLTFDKVAVAYRRAMAAHGLA